MGMYDTIQAKFKCPYCGQVSNMEFQTKALDCMLKLYRPGDRISEIETDYDFVDVTGSCHSPECQTRADKFSCSIQGCASGFGALFNARIRIKGGIITNTIIDVVPDENYTETYIEQVRNKWEPHYKPRGSEDYLTNLWNKVKCIEKPRI